MAIAKVSMIPPGTPPDSMVDPDLYDEFTKGVIERIDVLEKVVFGVLQRELQDLAAQRPEEK